MNKLFNFTVIAMLLAIIASACATDQPEPAVATANYTSFESLYAQAKQRTQERNRAMWSLLGVSNSRADTLNGNSLFWHLANLPEAEFDSIYNVYCSPENLAIYEDIYELNLQALIDLSSPEDVQNLFNFTKKYIEIGGHNPDFVNKGLHTTFVDSGDPIKEAMLEEVEFIDEVLPLDPDVIDSHRKCLETALKDNGIEIVIDLLDTGAAIYDPANIFLDVSSVVKDFSTVVKIVHEYHNCLITTAW